MSVPNHHFKLKLAILKGLSDSKVGVITYGGEGNWSKPAMTAVRGLATTENKQSLLTAIKRINFTGPDYTPASTVDALEFVVKTLNDASKGVAKCLLVVAPESELKVRMQERVMLRLNCACVQ